MAERVYESKYTGAELDAAVGIAQKVDETYVKKTTKINGKALEQDISLTASDISDCASLSKQNNFNGTNIFNDIAGFYNIVLVRQGIVFEGVQTIQVANNVTVTLPDTDGKLALTSDIDSAIQKSIIDVLKTPV